MRRLDEDKVYFNETIGNRIQNKNSIIYKVKSQVGRGTMESFKVMPGVELIYNDVEFYSPIINTFKLNVNCIEITYCLSGHVEIEFENQRYAVMSDGDISLFGYKVNAVSCDFSVKPFKGITVMIYFPNVVQSLNTILETKEFKEENFFKEVFSSDRCIINYATESLEHIFKELFIIPEKYNNHFMKIKVVELLLYLLSDMNYKKNDYIYFSKSSIDKIKEARKIIIDNVDKRITVKEISKQVKMNSTDLEKGFKSLYGATIFAYSKSYKMKKAKELLNDYKLSVLDIALSCGYGSSGKFAKAFKEEFNVTPTEYRKNKVFF
ncbi:MAG: transcriptional regulator, AraC family [Clostridiaceae bacterium]|nr:transcriptional regulator, AraC family [Clostridiaceae bacterium]